MTPADSINKITEILAIFSNFKVKLIANFLINIPNIVGTATIKTLVPFLIMKYFGTLSSSSKAKDVTTTRYRYNAKQTYNCSQRN